MRLVFLDIDGVLNTPALALQRPPGGGPPLAPEAVARLEQLTRETGAHVVVSSSWRLLMSLEALGRALGRVGLTAPLVGATPDAAMEGSLYEVRGLEISRWLEAHAQQPGAEPVTGYAILDDVDDVRVPHLRPHFVRVDPEVGLSAEDVERAREVLSLPVRSIP